MLRFVDAVIYVPGRMCCRAFMKKTTYQVNTQSGPKENASTFTE